MADYRISKKEPAKAGNFFKYFVAQNGSLPDIIQAVVLSAWDHCCPLPSATVYRQYRDGILNVKLKSSVLVSELLPSRLTILAQMQAYISSSQLLKDAGLSDTTGILTNLYLK